ncbi:GntR family transcriptional regulator [Cloacibacillus evryensis]|uniref:GntR family transcriptional regulator n=1 Tax=Cloacibacillus evryensis TaxID=508460 RepID=UPI00241C5EE2|nr:GntR family transcriptional regulator [Cloacibacillus evryensis]
MASKNEKASWIKVYDWIREGIDSCALKMGEPLPETFLANEIGVSRTPVREALRVLEQDGYIKIVPKKGAFVSEISIEDVREIYDIRKLLEPFAALSAANRIPDRDIVEMTAEWQELGRSFKKGEEIDLTKVADMDIRLHFTIASYATNKRICAILTAYHVQIKRFQRLSVQSLADMQNSIDQHLKILSCIKERDPKALHQCLYDHVVNSEGFIMKDYFLR